MAGDIGVAESVIDAGTLAALGAPPPMLHEYGGAVRIALGSAGRSGRDMAAEGPQALAAPPAPGESRGPETETLGLAALALRESDEYVAAKQQRPFAGANWGSAEGPEPLHEEGSQNATSAAMAAPAPQAEAPTPGTSDRLAGRVAVGLVIVDGPENRLRFSDDERLKVVAEVQNGLSWLGAQAPARDVTWVHDIQNLAVNAPETPSGTSYEAFEAPWRDAALAELGFGPGLAGTRDCVQDLRTRLSTDWAYCLFFVKYRLRHFAYASLGGPRLVMHYQNDAWGPDNIDRVAAHETGHIFGAPDEYASSACNCGGSYGHYGRPNGNCENCAQPLEECIMRANTWAMCRFTPYHLGFNISGAPVA